MRVRMMAVAMVVGVIVFMMVVIVRVAMIVVVRMLMAVSGIPGADALDVVVVTLLRQPDFRLEAQHLFAILAELAVHQVLPLQNFLHPIPKCIQHERVVVEVGCLDELYLRMPCRHKVGVVVDALHQDAGK